MAALSGAPVRGRRADWLTELVWKRVQQLAVLYPQDMLLDVAGEDGELLRRIALNEPEVGLAGICATPQLARTARYRVPEADIMYAELDDFPWLNHSFDVAMCLLSVSAMQDLPTTLSEVFRVLKPGGQFLFAAPWLPAPFRAMANRFLVDETEESAAVLTPKELLACLEKAGFAHIRYLRLAGLRCVAVCWKP
ncbi:MAG: methyltransferase domain-containing protein [Clostridia bacterium]|nr:methyltransferase domain-containing protein [Clostridia bacterium]